VLVSFKIFRNTHNFENWGISEYDSDISQFLLGHLQSRYATSDQYGASEIFADKTVYFKLQERIVKVLIVLFYTVKNFKVKYGHSLTFHTADVLSIKLS